MLVIWPGQIRTKPFNHSDAQPWGIEQVGIKFKRRYAVSPVENFANVAPPRSMHPQKFAQTYVGEFKQIGSDQPTKQN